MTGPWRGALDKYAFWRWHTRRGWPLASAHAAHWRQCRKQNRMESAGARAEEDAANFRRVGWLEVTPDSEREALATKIGERFGELIAAGHADATSEDGLPLLRLLNADTHLPAMVGLLRGRTAEALHAWYGCGYQVYTAYLYRLLPTVELPTLSWLWHSDDVPPGMIKVMVYLNPTTRRNGAFRATDAATSWRLLRSGFQDRDRAAEFLPILESSTRIFEGGPGFTVLFDNNILHKATAPEAGWRDAVVFSLIPSPEGEFDRQWARDLGTLSAELRPKLPADPRSLVGTSFSKVMHDQ